MEGLVDIGIIGNFIQCITGNFDSRYFNSLKGNEYTIVKSSSNKRKIKAEYCFYHLLPEDMKFWFVIPFNYKEKENFASYTMERLHMTDLAIKWVHGSMDEAEFEDLMDKYFFFFNSRHVKECAEEEYQKVTKALYVDKVNDRIADLKKLPEYGKIKTLLEASETTDIDSLVAKYFALKEKIEARVKYPRQFVIGHGDPCFANALYNKSTKTLKFIDPKGAITEDELWTNAYYDVAKLSHSVCGRYDFFNNALFDIKIDTTFEYSLEIPFDNSRYIEIFKRKAEENGFDYLTVRIYEASLFLSMLPLHIDNPHKVFGFILNVKMFKDYSFVFDIDGTICPIKKKDEKYEDLVPFPEIVEKLKCYKENGARIVLYTSRNMNSYNGNIGLINKHTAAVLSAWLEKWEIPYDEIVYGKVWPGHKGFYVDDRTVRPDEFLKYSPEELDKLCAGSRCNSDK